MATPKVETEDGLASMRDFINDEERADQCSESTIGMLRETLTFENLSMTLQGASKMVHVSNIFWNISFVKIATLVPPISGQKDGERNSTEHNSVR